MARILRGGADAFDVLAGGRLNEQTSSWLNNYTQQVTQTLSSTAQAFVANAQSLYQTVSDSTAMQMLRNLRHQNDHLWVQNHVEPLESVAGLQTASTTMRRWVMAHPETRRRYHNQSLEAWDDSYEDVHGPVYGIDHHDWREAMSGVIQCHGRTADYTVQVFNNGLAENETTLPFREKVDIQRTWAFIDNLLEEEEPEDYTSVYGARL